MTPRSHSAPGEGPPTLPAPDIEAALHDTSELKDSSRFAVQKRLGSGAMGVVYAAFDRERQEDVALKLLHTSDASALYRFKKEFRTLADVAHPNLVNLYELIAEDDQWFFTMEIVAGRSFFEYVRPAAGAPVDVERLRQALRQLAAGVQALHDAGKLHRDLKPPNVMVTGEGRVVILDFGLATELAPERQTVDSGLAGTVAYMAPEQAKSEEASAASDWYAVGVILFEALTGRLPFTGSLYDVLVGKQKDAAPSPTEFAGDLPPDLVELCDGLLAVEPDQRPSGAEILEVLGEAGEETSTGALPVIPGGALIGRRNQLAQLEEAYRCSRRGQATSVYVHGPSGMGKTALIQHFLSSLAHRSAVVLRGRCYEREMVPFKALDGVIDSLSRHLATLDERRVRELAPADMQPLLRLFPVLRRVFHVSSAGRQRQDSPDLLTLRRRAFESLRELLARIAGSAPLVLFIDDLQWADADSTALLEDLLRPPDPPPLVLLASFRTEEIDHQPFLQELLAHTGSETCRQLEIGVLNDRDAAELAASILGRVDATDPVLRAILKEAHGNPFLIEQLARYVQVKADALRTGLSLLEMLEERLSWLPSGARPLLLTMAVANRPLDAGVAHQAAGLTGDERSLVAQLRNAHFVRSSGSAHRIELYHDRIRVALATLIDAADIRRIHRRMAEALEARGFDDPEALFEHCLGAGDRSGAARHAALAAKKAFSALAFDPAARFYRQALELAPVDGVQRLELMQGLARSLANAGRSAESAVAYLEVADAAEIEALESQCRAAEQYLMGGHLEQGLEVARVVREAVGLKMAQGPKRALLSLLASRLKLRLRGLRFKERAAADVPAQDLVRIDTCWALANGLTMADTIQGSALQTRSLLLALRAGEPYRVSRALAMEVGFMSSTGSLKRARELCDRAMTLARRVDSPHAIGLATMQKGMLAYFSGEWRDATQALDEAEAIFSDRCSGVVWEMAVSRRFSLSGLLYLGEMAELSRRVPRSLAEAKERGNTYLSKLTRSRLNMVWLAADDPENADSQLTEIVAKPPPPGRFSVNRYNAFIAQIQTALYRDDPAAAQQHVRESWPALEKSLLMRSQLVRIEALQARARTALAAAENGGERQPLLELTRHAAGKIRREKRPWSDPLAALLQAAVAAFEDDAAGCRELLKAAADGFDAAQMALYAAAARRRLGAVTGDRALIDDVDAWMKEQRVERPSRMTAMLAPGFATD